MRRLKLLVLAALALVLVACEAATPSATPDATAVALPTPTAVPTPTPLPTPTATLDPMLAPTLTPVPSRTDALSILRAAEENLRRTGSYNVVASSGVFGLTLVADIVPPSRGYVYETYSDGHSGYELEILYVDESHYMRWPGYQVWFHPNAMFSPDRYGPPRQLHDFPYDLAEFREGIEDLSLQGNALIYGINAYRLMGTVTGRLAQDISFRDIVSRSRGGISEVEMWISEDELLPLSIEEIGGTFRVYYGSFGAKVDVSEPVEILDGDVFSRLASGQLSPMEMGRLVRALPVAGQHCLQAEIGEDLYREVLSGNSDADIVVRLALQSCGREIRSVWTDLIKTHAAVSSLQGVDLAMLSISAEEMTDELAECLRESIGLESLYEVGSSYRHETERAPTPEEVAAAEMCKP